MLDSASPKPELRAEFMAEAEAADQPASQVVRELMREYVQRQCQAREYDEFLHQKVESARKSVRAERGRSNAEIEVEFTNLPLSVPVPQTRREGCLDAGSGTGSR
ncbi:antitoxin of toxin-antitoxin stability system [Nitrosospira sp. NRS527]|uniref:antitoxin of toxin-antitoxin stability system n=1 Tax=Nitrosospira sp. NRS527 TaxID=155925 RepID=UPI001FD10D08|nr:antitoxin of toxin-antitoxin stability system [Nitrosospira sp. NRS527]